MEVSFITQLPFDVVSILISGDQSAMFLHEPQYLLMEEKGERTYFEIRYEYHCSPFKQAHVYSSILAVGFEEHFYLFDVKAKRNLLSLKCDGYFGYFYVYRQYLYVADACFLRCINFEGEIVWQSPPLGIDGVIVNQFTDTEIHGEGENDPPGGWINFKLDINTGTLISE